MFAILRAHFAYYFRIGKALDARKTLKGNPEKAYQELYPHFLPWQYFVKKNKVVKRLPGFRPNVLGE